ncbi:BTB/POZ domain-containing protein 6-like [Centruroides vittatus]|uniref:BTB/POZ domain-containing protein 6-like n=1 Tax=Centruroides vittatus TaxID=120091 RepID=UPI00350FE9CA
MAWQRNLTTDTERKTHLLSGHLSDVVIYAGNETKRKHFNVHKLILSMYSEVFENMFYGPDKVNDSEIKIDDIDCHSFESLLRFIYTDKMVACSEFDNITLYKAAHKYRIQCLVELCRSKLMAKMKVAHVWHIYELALEYSDRDLVEKCIEVVSKETSATFKLNYFLNIKLETLCELVTYDLKLLTENDLFEAVIRWATNVCSKNKEDCKPCNLRKILEPVLRHIRFLSLTRYSFDEMIKQCEILTEEETKKIKSAIENPQYISELPSWVCRWRKPRSLYKVCKYSCKLNNPIQICHPVIQSEISVTESIYLHGFGFFLIPNHPSLFLPRIVDVVVINKSCEEVDIRAELYHCKQTGFCRVMFFDPFPLIKSDYYKIVFPILNFPKYITWLLCFGPRHCETQILDNVQFLFDGDNVECGQRHIHQLFYTLMTKSPSKWSSSEESS